MRSSHHVWKGNSWELVPARRKVFFTLRVACKGGCGGGAGTMPPCLSLPEALCLFFFGIKKPGCPGHLSKCVLFPLGSVPVLAVHSPTKAAAGDSPSESSSCRFTALDLP